MYEWLLLLGEWREEWMPPEMESPTNLDRAEMTLGRGFLLQCIVIQRKAAISQGRNARYHP
jgi:hypothetical protein